MTHRVRSTSSEGSRKDAHNLDDLRERWILRKQTVNEISETSSVLPKEPDYFNPSSFDQLREWRSDIKNRIGQINVELSDLNHTHYHDKHLWFSQRQSLIAEIAYRLEIIRQMKPIFVRFTEEKQREERGEVLENIPEHIQELQQLIVKQKKKIGQLQKLLYEAGIDFPLD